MKECHNYFRYRDVIDYLNSNINRVKEKQYLLNIEEKDAEITCEHDVGCTFYETLLNISNLTGFELQILTDEEYRTLKDSFVKNIITKNSFIIYNTSTYDLSDKSNYKQKDVFTVNVDESYFEITLYSLY